MSSPAHLSTFARSIQSSCKSLLSIFSSFFALFASVFYYSVGDKKQTAVFTLLYLRVCLVIFLISRIAKFGWRLSGRYLSLLKIRSYLLRLPCCHFYFSLELDWPFFFPLYLRDIQIQKGILFNRYCRWWCKFNVRVFCVRAWIVCIVGPEIAKAEILKLIDKQRGR